MGATVSIAAFQKPWELEGRILPPTGAGVLQRRNVWGPDLSGSFQGAGGVGGLLMVEDRSTPAAPVTYHSCYDGNGNIVEVLTQNAAGAVTVAQSRTYDAFGRIWGGTGNGGPHRWRFSTKLLDEETGWSYYGYRLYDPVAGRWLSRDPIRERGGRNFYRMVKNNCLKRIDILGLEEWLFPENQNCEAVIALGHLGGMAAFFKAWKDSGKAYLIPTSPPANGKGNLDNDLEGGSGDMDGNDFGDWFDFKKYNWIEKAGEEPWGHEHSFVIERDCDKCPGKK